MDKSQKIDIKDIDFEGLFKSFFSPLVGFAYNIVGNSDVSKDLVQEVFMKIWDKKVVFESQKSIKVYLYLSTRNLCLDYIKLKRRKGCKKNIDPVYFSDVFKIEISGDGIDWESALPRTQRIIGKGRGESTIINFAKSISTRYVRFKINDKISNRKCTYLADFMIF